MIIGVIFFSEKMVKVDWTWALWCALIDESRKLESNQFFFLFAFLLNFLKEFYKTIFTFLTFFTLFQVFNLFQIFAKKIFFGQFKILFNFNFSNIFSVKRFKIFANKWIYMKSIFKFYILKTFWTIWRKKYLEIFSKVKAVFV